MIYSNGLESGDMIKLFNGIPWRYRHPSLAITENYSIWTGWGRRRRKKKRRRSNCICKQLDHSDYSV